MNKPLLACGHAANSTDENGNPSCVICIGINPDADKISKTPDLTKRRAKCAYGNHAIVNSSLDLPFFEYLGPGSYTAENACKCGYNKMAHNQPKSTCKCKHFVPRGPLEFDRYYCGCYGWD